MQNRREFIKNIGKLGVGLGVAGLGNTMLMADSSIHSRSASNRNGNLGNNPKSNDTKGVKMQTITLNNGVKMPIIGYGVFQITGKECQRCVEDAISVGYRLIDTAQSYDNEDAVGSAVRRAIQGNIKRSELFITTKVWINNTTEQGTFKAFESSLKKLGLDYIDLYLIHQPFNDTYGAWRAMSKLYKEGRIKAIGVSNFYPDRITDFCLHNEIKPAINQVECNPLHPQIETQENLRHLGVAMEAWAPFGTGKNNIFKNETIAKIGKKYGKSNAQVILRWFVERGIVSIPKTSKKERMIENISVFDFSLDSSDMSEIAKLDMKGSVFYDHRDIKQIKRLLEWKV